MPAVFYRDHQKLYEKAFGVLLRKMNNGSYRTREPSVLVVSQQQLRALAEEGVIPRDQLISFVDSGTIPPSFLEQSTYISDE